MSTYTLTSEYDEDLLVSIIICSYSNNRYRDLVDAIFSLLEQSYEKLSIIIVVDGNKKAYEKLERLMNDDLREKLRNQEGKKIKIILNHDNIGLSKSRNVGIREAEGHIIAFLDDDAIASKDWLENLVFVYRHFNAIGVGGKIVPLWISEKPSDFPEELFWIIGATHPGFPEYLTKVRNLFGSNLSFKKEVFEKVGLFNEDCGIKGSQQLQAEETEFSIRVSIRLGDNIIYNPNAIVYHKVFPEKTRLCFIFKRAFWQGYSKALLNSLHKSNVLSTESKYLKHLFFDFYPKSLKRFARQPFNTFKQLLMVTLVMMLVGTGFLYYKLLT